MRIQPLFLTPLASLLLVACSTAISALDSDTEASASATAATSMSSSSGNSSSSASGSASDSSGATDTSQASTGEATGGTATSQGDTESASGTTGASTGTGAPDTDTDTDATGTSTGTGTDTTGTTGGTDTGTTGGDLCADLDEKSCDAEPACMTIHGSMVDVKQACTMPPEFLACVPSGICGDAITYACPNDVDPPTPYEFLDTCIPDDFTVCEAPEVKGPCK